MKNLREEEKGFYCINAPSPPPWALPDQLWAWVSDTHGQQLNVASGTCIIITASAWSLSSATGLRTRTAVLGTCLDEDLKEELCCCPLSWIFDF